MPFNENIATHNLQLSLKSSGKHLKVHLKRINPYTNGKTRHKNAMFKYLQKAVQQAVYYAINQKT